MTAIRSIETERIVMRPMQEADFEPLWAIWSEEAVRRYLISLPETRADFRGMFDYMLEMASRLGMWTLVEKGVGEVFGRCGFYDFGAEQIPEVAFLLSERYWGRGLGTEAAQAALGCGFQERGWARIVALVRPDNLRSLSVIKKLGMTPAGTIDLKGWKAEIHEILRAKWTAAAAHPRE